MACRPALARVRGVDRTVHSGVYEFPAGTTPWNVLTMLSTGQKAALRFTVPEGLTILEVASLAAERPRASANNACVSSA